MSARFVYWLCPVCEFDLVAEHEEVDGLAVLAYSCPLCLDDTGRWVRMDGRPATAADKPEGPDARL